MARTRTIGMGLHIMVTWASRVDQYTLIYHVETVGYVEINTPSSYLKWLYLIYYLTVKTCKIPRKWLTSRKVCVSWEANTQFRVSQSAPLYSPYSGLSAYHSTKYIMTSRHYIIVIVKFYLREKSHNVVFVPLYVSKFNICFSIIKQ